MAAQDISTVNTVPIYEPQPGPVEEQSEPQTQVAIPPGGGGVKPPKRILIFLGVLVLISFLGVIVIRVILPRLQKPESITLVWWGLWEDSSIVTPLIEEYQSSHPNVKITYVKNAKEDYRERLTNELSKEGGPDIFRFHNTWVPMFREHLAPLPASVMSSSEFSQTYYPVVSSDLTVGTSIVGLPLGFDGLGLFINEELFEKAGKSPPRLWDELRETARFLTTRDEFGSILESGIALGRTENVDNWQDILALMMLQNGADLTRPTGKLAEDALKFFSAFSSQDRVWDETLPPSTQAFANAKVAMIIAPSWRVFEILAVNPSLNFKVVPVPQLPKLDEFSADVTWASYWVEGVSQASQNKDQAWEFLKFISSYDSLAKLYTNASRLRAFGEPYPRVDMASLISDDPKVGAFVLQGQASRSWYLASRTFDGPTGINSQVSKYYEDAVNGLNDRGSAAALLETVSQGVPAVLSQYGIR